MLASTAVDCSVCCQGELGALLLNQAAAAARDGSYDDAVQLAVEARLLTAASPHAAQVCHLYSGHGQMFQIRR